MLLTSELFADSLENCLFELEKERIDEPLDLLVDKCNC